jgi:hypothetical protein
MMLLLLIAVVLVVFAFFWWAGRDIKPDRDGAQENFNEALGGDGFPGPDWSGH